MDAKPPQRAFFRTTSTAGLRNENAVPSHQRHKSTGASMIKENSMAVVKIPSKRTAFGDVSNVVRHALLPATCSAKGNNSSSGKAVVQLANPISVPPAVVDKENATQAAGAGIFAAPAQRPRHTNAPVAVVPARRPVAVDTNSVQKDAPQDLPAPNNKPSQSVAARKSSVVFINDIAYYKQSPVVQSPDAVLDEDSPDYNVWDWKSPIHSQSQPCLKTYDELSPISRAFVNNQACRQAWKEADALSDAASTESKDQTSNQHAASLAASASAPALADTTNSLPSTHTVSGIVDQGAALVQAVQQFHAQAVPPSSHLLDIDTKAPVDHAGNPAAVDKEATSSPLTELTADYTADVQVTAATSIASEVEERWEDDAEFIDDQAYTTAHSFRSLGDNTTDHTTIVMPKFTAKIQNELDIAKSIVEALITPEEIDDENWDISMVAEYGEDIYQYSKELEVRLLPNPYYMDMQTEIQWSMRAVLMEWLIQVHARFNLLPETLFLTVNYVDRFLSAKNVSVAKLQLVGATALFIAAKYEEISCPSIQEIVYMVDGGYPAEEILKAERYMLSMLGFELGWPGPMSFLRRISKADDYDVDARTLAKYFLEVTVMDERFVACPPSFLAAGAHCLARLMLHKGDWTTAHTHYSGYTWSQVRPLANMILQCCSNPKSHHAVVYDKYGSNKFKKSSIYVEEALADGFVMPPLQPLYAA